MTYKNFFLNLKPVKKYEFSEKEDNEELDRQHNENEVNIKFIKFKNVLKDILKEYKESDKNKNVSKLSKEFIPKENNLSINKEIIETNIIICDIIKNSYEIPAKSIESIKLHKMGIIYLGV